MCFSTGGQSSEVANSDVQTKADHGESDVCFVKVCTNIKHIHSSIFLSFYGRSSKQSWLLVLNSKKMDWENAHVCATIAYVLAQKFLIFMSAKSSRW